MTTNDGMPKPVKSAPWTTPIAIPHKTPAAIARYGSQPCLTFSTAITAAAQTAHGADRKVDLAQQQHVHDADRDQARPP